MSVPHPTTPATTPATPSLWDQVPKIVKTVICVIAGIILLVIIFSVLSWYRNLPKHTSTHTKSTTSAELPQSQTIRVSDYLKDGVKSTSVTITEEITLDQDVPYSEVTNIGEIFCDGTPIESRGAWPGGYKRYRTIKPQSGSIKLLLEKP